MNLWKQWRVLPALSFTALALVGCGKAASFEKQEFNATAVAAQYTKPKIDILFVQDKSSSMATPISSIKSQLNGFLDGIDGNWDYHFTVVPLQSVLPITSKWIIAQDCKSIAPSQQPYCLTNSQKSAFNSATSGDYAWINSIDTSTANTDLGFSNIQGNLSHSSMASTGFLRPDAALAVVVLSNGEDVSGVSYKDRGDGVMVVDYTSTTSQTSFNNFKNFLGGLKGTLDQVKFYSVVATNNYSNCYGGSAWQGKRYMDMANAVNGYQGFYNICDGSGLGSVLSSIKYQLDAMIQAYIFSYAVLDAEPIVSSIVVKKNGVTIPQSNTNGWQYMGYLSNQPISYFPTLSNNKSGYMIKLNGSAEYKGSDVISIDFQRK